MTAPAIPPGPLVSLVYRVAPERREELLAFFRGAFPTYERPGGIRMGLYESIDEPGLWFELVAYAGEAEYARDQRRVEEDPEMRALLARWRAHVDGAVEVRRLRPIPIEGENPSQRDARVGEAAFSEHAAVAALLEAAGLPVPGPEDQPVTMLVARDAGQIVGSVGFERRGASALLRSLAVTQTRRRQGLGRELVRELCARLAASGVERVVLVTLSAAPFFEALGFSPIARDAIPVDLLSSRELGPGCCATAQAMCADLPLHSRETSAPTGAPDRPEP